MSGSCEIFCGGDPVGREVYEAARVPGALRIAADSGYRLCEALGVRPDIVVGDFDSSDKPEGVNVLTYPVRKDDTDLMLAVREGLRRGADSFTVFGATGGRLDHTFAAVQSLAFLLDNGASGRIVSENERIFLLDPGSHTVPAFEGFTLSLFAYSPEVGGLTLAGTDYPAQDITLGSGFPLGVSNHFAGREAGISFRSGRLLVICSRE
ncbi:MAG: thiamine diphosphokinase [Ruminococcus sp.]|nr:thiamine diphosphokinase [Ruminococcus sp.]